MTESLAYIVAGLRPLAIPIDSCHPDPANARKGHAVDRIAGSLAQYGQRKAIVVNASEGNKIEAGNGTWLAAKSLGWSHIAAVIVEDDPMTAVGYGIADNRLGHLSEWDAGTLAALLDSIDDDLPTGFEGDELEELLAELGAELDAGTTGSQGDAEPQVDRAEELRQKWGTELGQLWQIGEHRLIVGDCTDRAVVERVMGGEGARLVVTDPPYGVSYADKNIFLNAISPANRIETPIENDHQSKEETQAMWKAAFAEMSAIMDRGAVVYCFMPQGGDQMMMMMMMMMMGAGIEPRHELIWLKNNHVLGRVDYAYKHEPILYAWKEAGHKFYGDFQTSILEFPKPQVSSMHPTTKPVELIKRLVSNSSLSGEIVYDPFAGSGTTLVACQNLSRRCRAIEISPAYCAVILQRMSDAFPGIDIRQVT